MRSISRGAPRLMGDWAWDLPTGTWQRGGAKNVSSGTVLRWSDSWRCLGVSEARNRTAWEMSSSGRIPSRQNKSRQEELPVKVRDNAFSPRKQIKSNSESQEPWFGRNKTSMVKMVSNGKRTTEEHPAPPPASAPRGRRYDKQGLTPISEALADITWILKQRHSRSRELSSSHSSLLALQIARESHRNILSEGFDSLAE
jgi:hypothetical protein